MYQRTRITKRLLGIAAAGVILAITAHTAIGKGGGKNSAASATLAFDDLIGDAILSDGLGPYEGSIARDGSLVIATGDRSLTFDFGWVEEVAGVTITVSSLDGDIATADFEFRAADFWWSYGNATDEWIVTMSVSVTRVGDSYRLAPVSDAEVWYREHNRGRWISERGPEWVLLAVVDMPWGAVVSP